MACNNIIVINIGIMLMGNNGLIGIVECFMLNPGGYAYMSN